MRKGEVDLKSPATTLALLKLNSVVGVRGFFDANGNRLQSVGITCALCHSTVDNSFAPGIGHRQDGWAARDLNVGAIIALSPSVQPFVDLLRLVDPSINAATVRKVLRSWGPGKFDAELLMDGKAFRPDGKSAATLIPPAFGLAGVNLHTWTGWGSVTHWNGFVANLEMQGKGTFYDPRLNDAAKFPIAAIAGFGDVRNEPDLVTPKLASSTSTSSACPHRRRQQEASTRPQPIAGKRSSPARRTARAVTCLRYSRSRAGTCTRRKKSESTHSRPTVHPTVTTGPRHSRACGPIRRAATTTTGALRRSAQ